MNAPSAVSIGAQQGEVRLFTDLEAVAVDAAGALDRARQPSPYATIEWLRLTRDHILADDALIAARAAIGGDRAWLFLKAGGTKGEAFASWYTLSFAPVYDAPEATRDALVQAIARALRPRLARITLAPMPQGEADRVAGAFRAAGWWPRVEDATANWVAHTAGMDFATYWAARPSRLRNTYRRKAKDSPFTIEMMRVYDDAAWDAYEAIYAQSWKPSEGSPAFLRAFARAAGQAGALRFGLARRGDTPVACQFWTVDHGVATIHKLAHVETERAASPGTLLSEAMFRDVITHDQPERIDFGTGDDAYKADWMDERRMLCRVILHNPGRVAGLAGAARMAGARWLRGVRHG